MWDFSIVSEGAWLAHGSRTNLKFGKCVYILPVLQPTRRCLRSVISTAFNSSNRLWTFLTNFTRANLLLLVNGLKWRRRAGRELVSGFETRWSRSADLLGVRLLHAGDHVHCGLRRHRLCQSNRTILHGLLHTRSPGQSLWALVSLSELWSVSLSQSFTDLEQSQAAVKTRLTWLNVVRKSCPTFYNEEDFRWK